MSLNWHKTNVRKQISKNGQEHWYDIVPRKGLVRIDDGAAEKEIERLNRQRSELQSIKDRIDLERKPKPQEKKIGKRRLKRLIRQGKMASELSGTGDRLESGSDS